MKEPEIFKAIRFRNIAKIAEEAKKLTDIPFFEGFTPLHRIFAVKLENSLFSFAQTLLDSIQNQDLKKEMQFACVSSECKNQKLRGLTLLQFYVADRHLNYSDKTLEDEELTKFFKHIGEESMLNMLLQAAGAGNYRGLSLLHFFVDQKEINESNNPPKPLLKSIESFFEPNTEKYGAFMAKLFSKNIEEGSSKGLTPLHYSLQKDFCFKRLLEMIKNESLHLFYDVFVTPLSADVNQSIRGLTLLHHAFLKNKFSFFDRFFQENDNNIRMHQMMLVSTSVNAGEKAGLPLLQYAVGLPEAEKLVPDLFKHFKSDEKLAIFEELTTKDAGEHAGLPLFMYALTLKNAEELVPILLKEGDKKVIFSEKTGKEAGKKAGLFPIHIALRYAENPEKVIAAILNEIPKSEESLKEKLLLAPTTADAGDDQGLTPLHYALTSKDPAKEVNALLDNVKPALRKKMFLATGAIGKALSKTVLEFAQELSGLPAELTAILEQQKNLFILENILETLKKKLIILLGSVKSLS
jgi:ankyrin repeat protein